MKSLDEVTRRGAEGRLRSGQESLDHHLDSRTPNPAFPGVTPS